MINKENQQRVWQVDNVEFSNQDVRNMKISKDTMKPDFRKTERYITDKFLNEMETTLTLRA